MIRLLLNAEAPIATEPVTRFGGLPLIPADSAFQWPICSTCNGAMQFLGQIALNPVVSEQAVPDQAVPKASNPTQLLLIFKCTNDPGMCQDWDPDLGGNSALLVNFEATNRPTPRLANPPEHGVTLRETVYGARIQAVHVPVDLPGDQLTDAPNNEPNYEDARLFWIQQCQMPPQEILGAIGGEPLWVQQDETPTCNHCGNPMTFVAQLEEGPDRKTCMNFGGGGCAYLFLCSCAEGSAKFLWQNP